jgi:hypothetical protein
MTPQRILYRALIRLLEYLSMRRSFRSCHSSRLSIEPLQQPACDLITVAFNHPETIERQIHFVHRYCLGAYHYLVADNSTDRAASRAIEALCDRHQVAYIRLPKNHLTATRGGSYSHGTALNWIYRRIVRPRHPHHFGFIDHDLFPIRPVDPSALLLHQPVYGYRKERDRWWYLWAGFCFFDFDFVDGKPIDFLPAKPGTVYLDTGGGNWYSLYAGLDHHPLTFATYRFEPEGERAARREEYLDETWMHTIDASNWEKHAPEIVAQREKEIRELLEKYW